jgi:hypothetical protein
MPRSRITIAGRTLTLDARPDRLDLRDLRYRPSVANLPPEYPASGHVDQLLPLYLQAGLVLDQGEEGACTGFGLAAVVNFLLWLRSRPAAGESPTMTAADRVSPRMLYHLARFYDEWPGEDYEGSSCRGALKGWHRHGVCLESLWPYDPARFIEPEPGWDEDAVRRPLGVYYRIDRQSVVDVQAAIWATGAVYVSAQVHAGWDVKPARGRVGHATLPVIRPRASAEGGHAFALVGYNALGFIVQNSWGERWGASGFAILPYEEWVTHGTDAWVVALGAPIAQGVRGSQKGRPLASPRHFVTGSSRAGVQIAGLPGWLGAEDPLESKPHAWPESQAYAHTLVTGNDGAIMSSLPFVADAAGAAEYVCFRRPAESLAGGTDARRLVVYAHGGLNSQSDSIQRIRALAPYFQDNGIYPIFTTWQSGWRETLAQMIEDGVERVLGLDAVRARGLSAVLSEAADRAIEALAREVMVRGMWSEMKENVARGTQPGHGLEALAHWLGALRTRLGGLEIHLVGHSAGSFVCGRLLSLLRVEGIRASTCTLYAPACDLAFAREHFQAAVDAGTLARAALRVHVLSDRREREDSVGPYRKSLLYLVSRALERRHRTPILGLASAFDPERASADHWHEATLADVHAWQSFFWGADAPAGFADRGRPGLGGGLEVLDRKQVSAGPRQIAAAHGCFDNAVDVVSDTIAAILGLPPGAKPPYRVKDLDY